MTPPGPKIISPRALLDASARVRVDAELWRPVTEKNLLDWETHWRPAIDAQLKLLSSVGIERKLWPQSREWDWRAKHNAFQGKLSHETFAVMAEGTTQAMMIVDLDFRARLEDQRNQHLIYIDYLETAPWNRATLSRGLPKFAGAGSLLIGEAISVSMEMGFKGRIGLHSLPQSNDFYANRCGMLDLGADENYERLRYFEMTPEVAEAFLAKGGRLVR